ncbi:MAG: YihY/virulence factor BrkB family protein [Desulfovermiculus sp.]
MRPDHEQEIDGAEKAGDGLTKLLLNTLLHYFQEKTWRLAASVTFYVLFAVVPLILFATALAGLPFDQEEARTAILRQLDDIVGEQGSAAIKEMLQNYKKPTQGVVSAILGLMALMFGSVNALAQLRDAMNSIWKVKMDVFIHSGYPAGSSLCLCLRVQKGRFLIQNSESSIQILKPGRRLTRPTIKDNINSTRNTSSFVLILGQNLLCYGYSVTVPSLYRLGFACSPGKIFSR